MANYQASDEHGDDAGMVTVYRSADTESNFEAESIKALLESNGIQALVIGDTRLPNFDYRVRVAGEDADRARAAIEEARKLGPQGAEEAEANEADFDGVTSE